MWRIRAFWWRCRWPLWQPRHARCGCLCSDSPVLFLSPSQRSYGALACASCSPAEQIDHGCNHSSRSQCFAERASGGARTCNVPDGDLSGRVKCCPRSRLLGQRADMQTELSKRISDFHRSSSSFTTLILIVVQYGLVVLVCICGLWLIFSNWVETGTGIAFPRTADFGSPVPDAVAIAAGGVSAERLVRSDELPVR